MLTLRISQRPPVLVWGSDFFPTILLFDRRKLFLQAMWVFWWTWLHVTSELKLQCSRVNLRGRSSSNLHPLRHSKEYGNYISSTIFKSRIQRQVLGSLFLSFFLSFLARSLTMFLSILFFKDVTCLIWKYLEIWRNFLTLLEIFLRCCSS